MNTETVNETSATKTDSELDGLDPVETYRPPEVGIREREELVTKMFNEVLGDALSAPHDWDWGTIDGEQPAGSDADSYALEQIGDNIDHVVQDAVYEMQSSIEDLISSFCEDAKRAAANEVGDAIQERIREIVADNGSIYKLLAGQPVQSGSPEITEELIADDDFFERLVKARGEKPEIEHILPNEPDYKYIRHYTGMSTGDGWFKGELWIGQLMRLRWHDFCRRMIASGVVPDDKPHDAVTWAKRWQAVFLATMASDMIGSNHPMQFITIAECKKMLNRMASVEPSVVGDSQAKD